MKSTPPSSGKICWSHRGRTAWADWLAFGSQTPTICLQLLGFRWRELMPCLYVLPKLLLPCVGPFAPWSLQMIWHPLWWLSYPDNMSDLIMWTEPRNGPVIAWGGVQTVCPGAWVEKSLQQLLQISHHKMKLSRVVARISSESAGNTAMLFRIGRYARSPVPLQGLSSSQVMGTQEYFAGVGGVPSWGNGAVMSMTPQVSGWNWGWFAKEWSWRAAGDGNLLG